MNAQKIVSALGGTFLLAASFAAVAQVNGGRSAEDAPVGSIPIASGAPLCRAAINSNGTIAGGGGTLTSAANLGTGFYEVIWKGRCLNVTAANGFSTWIQTHTFTTGAVNAYCTAADRAGNPNGTFVACYSGNNVPTDVSFFIRVEK